MTEKSIWNSMEKQLFNNMPHPPINSTWPLLVSEDMKNNMQNVHKYQTLPPPWKAEYGA